MEGFRELKETYLDGVQGELVLLYRCLDELRADPQAEQPLKVFRERAHRLKGSGGSYGYPQISLIASRMEEVLQRGQLAAEALVELRGLLRQMEELTRAEGRLAGEGEAAGDGPDGGRPRVTIIDDDPHLLQLISEHLHGAGFAVTTLQDPTRALETLSEAPPDLLLLDIEMPKLNGIEICESLRAREEFQTLPIFFLTSRSEEEMKVKGLEVGADDYITKPFNPDELIARIAARLERNRIMLELANRDGLTGLYNHCYFQEQLRSMIERSKRYNRKFSLVMLDIDRFKGINDRYGHQMGDRVLKALADLIMERGRKSDVAVRYGGDELAIIMPDCDQDDCRQVLSRLQRGFHERRFRPDDSAEPFQVTFSVGIASFPEDGVLPDMLIQNADRALYRAKRRGRRQIISFKSPDQDGGPS